MMTTAGEEESPLAQTGQSMKTTSTRLKPKQVPWSAAASRSPSQWRQEVHSEIKKSIATASRSCD
jgi:hypothetical protein